MMLKDIFKNGKILLLSLILFVVSFSLLLTSCYPGDPISPSDTDVVTTFKNSAADFSARFTYAMPDSVIHLGKDGPVESESPAIDQQILSAVERNMAAAGYTPEANPDQADVLVVAVVRTTQWVTGGCYPWYWGYYYPYPGYCYPVAYTYETGSLLIIMVDPERSGENDPREALWIAGINGLLSSSSNTAARINSNVDQAFKQSPYLSDGK